MKNTFISTHSIIKDRLTLLRDKNTNFQTFRTALNDIATILGIEATRDLPLEPLHIETPLASHQGHALASRPLIIPILRAGLALSESLNRILPHADTGHIGLYRDEETHKPVEYLVKLPSELNRPIFICDPMLATGHSMIKTLDILCNKGAKPQNVIIVTLLCAPEGLEELRKFYPDSPVYTAAIDSHLNENAYIVPGLGDAGDRYFGTV
jgi:uracil phosphoribosyltransferase